MSFVPPVKPKPSSLNKPKPPVGVAAIKAYQEQVSPKGMAAAEAAARKALDKKYPGLYLPEIRKVAGVKR